MFYDYNYSLAPTSRDRLFSSVLSFFNKKIVPGGRLDLVIDRAFCDAHKVPCHFNGSHDSETITLVNRGLPVVDFGDGDFSYLEDISDAALKTISVLIKNQQKS